MKSNLKKKLEEIKTSPYAEQLSPLFFKSFQKAMEDDPFVSQPIKTKTYLMCRQAIRKQSKYRFFSPYHTLDVLKEFESKS